MGSSHHLVTVCMFCLLCATHSSCSAHDGLLTADGQTLRKYQDLKHEKIKANVVPSKGHLRNYISKMRNLEKDESPTDGVDLNNNNVNYRIGQGVHLELEEMERINERLGMNLNIIDGHGGAKFQPRATHVRMNHPKRDDGDDSLENKYSNEESERRYRDPRNKLIHSAREEGYHTPDFKHKDISRRLFDLKRRKDGAYFVRSSRHWSNVFGKETGIIRKDLDIMDDVSSNIFDVNYKSRVSHAKDDGTIDRNIKDNISNMKNVALNNILMEHSESLDTKIDLNSKSVPNMIKETPKDGGRTKRDAHLPEGDANKGRENQTASNSTEYKPNLKNIDVDFYLKKLFTQFGDIETMTMNLEGFDRMLAKLDLDKMVLVSRILQNGGYQQPPIEVVVNGVLSNSSVRCVNSIDLVSSLNAQSKVHHNHTHTDHDHHSHEADDKHHSGSSPLDTLKSNIHLNARVLTKVCPILLYQKVADNSYERHGCVVEREYAKVNSDIDMETLFPYKNTDSEDAESDQSANNRTAVWTYSCLCILLISLCGLLGVAVIPIMHHTYYQQILQFFVALAVGTLSGDALLHLLPHALSSSPHGHSHSGSDHHHTDSMWKGLVAMIGVVFFYFTEKFLTLITEWRKRRMRADKENKLPLRVRVMRNDIGCLKGSGSCSSHSGKDGFLKLPASLSIFKPNSNNKDAEQNSVPSSGKICKHKYSEYPYCYDEIATETLEDHHHRDAAKNSNVKWNNANSKGSNEKPNEDGPLSVVSLNVSNDQDHVNANSNSEPGVNDSLLAGDSIKANNAGMANNRLQAKDYKKEDFTSILDGAKKKFEASSNGGKRRMGVKIVDGHGRSRSADRATELEDFDLRKTPNQEESYTVILREHSQTHHGHSHSHGHVHSPPSSLSSVVWMVIMGDGLHNFTDGMAIGAAFSSNIAGGFSTAIAVLCHELPHEIGDFAVLLKAGMSAKRAVCYNLLSSILCLFGMVVGIMAGHTPQATAWIFAAAAGMFLYIALVDMIPELSSSHSNEGSFCQCLLQLCGLTCGIGIMLLIAMYEDHLKRLFG